MRACSSSATCRSGNAARASSSRVAVGVSLGRGASVCMGCYWYFYRPFGRSPQPVSIGDLLSFYATVTRVGRTSVTVHVEVIAERNPANPHVVKVTEANLTYVAIDLQGKPREIPKE